MLKSARSATRYNWRYILTALVAGLLTYGNLYLKIQVPQNPIIFIGIKVAIVSIVTSAILVFYRSFLADLAIMKEPKEFHEVALYYKSPFNWLFSVDVVTFISLGSDLYIAVGRDGLLAQSISNGCFAAAIICLFTFMVSLHGIVFKELRFWKGIGTRKEQAPSEEAEANSSKDQARHS